jgi:hypothetical protein
MKRLNSWFVLIAFLAAADVRAQDVKPAQNQGTILLLQSERGLEGKIEKIGDQYRIQRGSSEVWLPAEKSMRLCVDWDDAYAFMKSRANLGDPEERLRLAHWCQMNNLKPQALEEAKEALKMRPNHAESRQLVAMLTRSLAAPQNSAAAATRPNKTVPTPPIDVSSDTLALFVTRVQPILMNTCVNCHSGGKGGDFQLIRAESGQHSATQTNLAAVLKQLNVDTPVLSPLLIKAVSRHGNTTQSPIKDRKAVAYQSLIGWIDYLFANNPQLKSKEIAGERRGVGPPITVTVADATRVPRRSPDSDFGANRPANEETQVNVQDSFDPAVFNRQLADRRVTNPPVNNKK